MKPRARHAPRSGHTLVEVIVAATLAALLIGSVGLVTLRASGAYQAGFASSGADAGVQRAIRRVAAEFMDADRSSLALSPAAPQAGSALDFARGTGMAGGALVVGPTRRVRFEYGAGETDNGLDDDGDGLVDEGRIALYPDLVGDPQLRAVLVEDVREYLEGELPNGVDDNGNGLADERGFALTYDTITSTLTLRATVERALPGGAAVARTAQTSIWIRND